MPVLRFASGRSGFEPSATVPVTGDRFPLTQIVEADSFKIVVTSGELAWPTGGDQIAVIVGAPERVGNDVVEARLAAHDQTMEINVACPDAVHDGENQVHEFVRLFVNRGCAAPPAVPVVARIDLVFDSATRHSLGRPGRD